MRHVFITGYCTINRNKDNKNESKLLKAYHTVHHVSSLNLCPIQEKSEQVTSNGEPTEGELVPIRGTIGSKRKTLL